MNIESYPETCVPGEYEYSDWFASDIDPESWGVFSFAVKADGLSEIQCCIPEGDTGPLRRFLHNTLGTPWQESKHKITWMTPGILVPKKRATAAILRSWITLRRNPGNSEMEYAWRRWRHASIH